MSLLSSLVFYREVRVAEVGKKKCRAKPFKIYEVSILLICAISVDYSVISTNNV